MIDRAQLRLLLLLPAMAVALLAAAQTDDEQAELRLAPEIELNLPEVVNPEKYPFLDLSANRIELNGADWSRLAAKFEGARNADSLFSVVYLGDSHVQADFGGDVLRDRLTALSRNAGRGITIPFRLASTNQPVDYTIRSESGVKASKLLKQPWITDMPFTGIGIRPLARNHNFTITCRRLFSRVNIYYMGASPDVTDVSEAGVKLPYEVFDSGPGEISVRLDRSVESLRLGLRSDNLRTTYAGFELLSDTVGTVVHSIGNNGATYGTYNRVEDMGRGLARLHPDLVIIALGTNEAFGRASAADIRAEIDILVSDIRRANPAAQLLLVGPAECYRKVYRYVRRKGKRRRVSSTVVNAKVKTVRDIIRAYAADQGIPYYDHYGVAGGSGAAAKMKAAGILGRDGIHYSATGYRLWGSLLADAIMAGLVVCPQ